MNKSSLKKSVGSLGKKAVKSDKLFYTFLRSAVSSQAGGLVDMGMSFVVFAWIWESAFWSTVVGAICGGVVNCLLCYKFTFHAHGIDLKAMVVKYVMVWIGSMLLNSYGTDFIYYMISDWDWLEQLGFRPDGYFASARLFVSIAVSWFWNFPLQKFFVYAPTSFDRYASALLPRTHGHSDTEMAD